MKKNLLIVTVCLCILLAACSDKDSAREAQAHVIRYICPGFSATVTLEPKHAVVKFAGKQVDLPQVSARRGSKYSSANTLYWRKNPRHAAFKVNGKLHEGCVAVSRLANIGPHLYAVGAQPAWMLRLQGGVQSKGTAEFVVQDDQQGGEITKFQDIRAVKPAATTASRPVIYGGGSGDALLSVVVATKSCARQGHKNLPLTVVVHLGNKSFHGCGERIP